MLKSAEAEPAFSFSIPAVATAESGAKTSAYMHVRVASSKSDTTCASALQLL